jgi:hypothetical protein
MFDLIWSPTKATTVLHNRQLHGILNAPFATFQKQSTGYFLNRFSTDQFLIEVCTVERTLPQ